MSCASWVLLLLKIGYKMVFLKPSLISKGQASKFGLQPVTSSRRPLVRLQRIFRENETNLHIAIGYSTNLIGQESNLIVIRGGDIEKGGLSVYEQMYTAAEQFFPDSDILSEEDVQNEKTRLGQMNHDLSLHRINTGMSSVVGHNNGERPGGFVLVIDGAALGFVSIFRLLLY